MAKPINKFYVRPEDFQEAFTKSIEVNEPTEKLLKIFFKISKHSSVLLNLQNKQDIDACVNYAVTEAWNGKWRKYNSNRSTNIFSFFTTMLLNDMRTHKNVIQKNKGRCLSIDTIFSGQKEK